MTTATITPAPPVPAVSRRGRGVRRRRQDLAGYLFLSPWLLGLLGITAVPMLISLYLSFTDYSPLVPITDANWIGLGNYRHMFTADPSYWHSVRVTVLYALIATPLKLAVALAVALLLNRTFRGIALARGLFYLPSLLGGSVGLAIVWRSMFDRNGAFNSLLGVFGIHGAGWVDDPRYALETLMLLAVWQFGAPMVIFLAGLKQVPAELYEAASVDGAGPGRKFLSITLPMLSPVIFFNLVLETIHGFQGFTSAFVISNGRGGPVDSTLMYTLNLYKQGFGELNMGYASAMAWVFLVAVGLITVVFFTTGRFWVHYSDNEER